MLHSLIEGFNSLLQRLDGSTDEMFHYSSKPQKISRFKVHTLQIIFILQINLVLWFHILKLMRINSLLFCIHTTLKPNILTKFKAVRETAPLLILDNRKKKVSVMGG